MVVFPNCKINIGLKIGVKRADGFHNLETIFVPIPITDALEILPAGEPTKNQINFSQTGIKIDSNNEDNICVKASQLLLKDYPSLGKIRIHLHKAIPIGAGLGGGSADAAFTLRLLNQKFKLNLSSNQLINYALQLGSDCPFFILNKPCYATSRGEILEPINIDLSAYKIVIVNTGIPINTGWAFKQLQSKDNTSSLINFKEAIYNPIDSWKINLMNDFEAPVFEQFPILKKIKNDLYCLGAKYAAMSGSGSTLYGIFDKQSMPAFNFPPEYFVKTLLLK